MQGNGSEVTKYARAEGVVVGGEKNTLARTRSPAPRHGQGLPPALLQVMMDARR